MSLKSVGVSSGEGACLFLRCSWRAEMEPDRKRPSESVLIGQMMANSDRT